MEILTANEQNLGMIVSVVDKLGKEKLTKPLQILSGSSVGQHIRHMIEFYVCLNNSFECGEVSYDNRERRIELETNPREIKNVINTIQKELRKIDLNKKVIMTGSFSEEKPVNGKVESTIYRELAYCLEHTIHHLAIVKMAVKSDFPEIKLDNNLGVAYSTIRYKKENVSTIRLES